MVCSGQPPEAWGRADEGTGHTVMIMTEIFRDHEDTWQGDDLGLQVSEGFPEEAPTKRRERLCAWPRSSKARA